MLAACRNDLGRNGKRLGAVALTAVFAGLVLALALAVCAGGQRAVADESESAAFEPVSITGVPLAGTSDTFLLWNEYGPANKDAANFYREDDSRKWAGENFSVSSSDPDVVAGSIESGFSTQLVLNYKAEGSAVVTIRYLFEGDHGTYSASQDVEVTVAGASNYITNMVVTAGADASIDLATGGCAIPVVSSCAVCGKTHGYIRGADLIFEATPNDPSSALTNDVSITWEIVNPEVLEVRSVDRIDENTFGVDLCALTAGASTDITFTSSSADGSAPTVSQTVSILVVEADKPTLRSAEEITVDTLYAGVEMPHGTQLVNMRDEASFIRYEAGDCLNLINGEPLYGEDGSLNWTSAEMLFAVFGEPARYVEYGADGEFVNREKQVCFFEVEDEDVAEIDESWGALQAVAVAEGETTLVFNDIWGNRAECRLVSMSYGDEAVANYSLVDDEITLQVGEVYDLRKLVQGSAKIDYFVFKPSDKSVVGMQVIDGGSVAGLFCAIGRTPGDVTVTAGVLNDFEGDYGGSSRYIDLMRTADFGTLTIHVVESTSEPAFAATSDDGTAVELYDSMDRANLSNVQFVVSPAALSDDTATAAVESVVSGEDIEIVDALDLRLEDEETAERVAVGDWMTLRVALTDEMKGYDADSLKVFYVTEDGSQGEAIDSWIEGDYLYFVTNHFSDYVIAGARSGFTDDGSLLLRADVGSSAARFDGAGIVAASEDVKNEIRGLSREGTLKFVLDGSELAGEQLSQVLEKELKGSGSKVLADFETRFTNRGLDYAVGGNAAVGARMSIRIPLKALPENADLDTISVFKIAGDGSYNELGVSSFDGSNLLFVTSDFGKSTYAVVGCAGGFDDDPSSDEFGFDDPAAPGRDETDGSGLNGSDSSDAAVSGESNPESDAAKQGASNAIASTGDTAFATMAFAGVFAVVSFGVVVLGRRLAR